ncbi:MAG: DNA repair protein RecN [Spirochaetes bacterium GWF1_31_7]|nr:MAG: DNA repair protein RecN [Spirochaetes bacterium GWE1_32_154]OHD47047.1 MAG: DNA repair protein RecN [Spirochaetes bacterium GWE2_31_10]OHD53053.1 MAG: DNA repair protein RecN [Spirochaetes bacterium GWF1_31_7]
MISNLTVRNFALIENCELNLSEKLNIISGETGSGKSIIIQALAILLGDRASVDQIRSGMDEAILTATISIDNNKYITKYLDNLGILIENDEIVLRRNLLASGKSRSFINGTQVTSKELSYISSILFDFHGQHDGIGLLKKETHIRYLDGYLKIENKISKLQELYHSLNTIKKELEQLSKNESDKAKKIELLEYEIDEIEKAKIQQGEDNELNEKIKIFSNMEKIVNLSNELSTLFTDEKGIINMLKNAKNITGQLAELDKDFSQNENDLTDFFYKVEDISSELINRVSKYNFNTQQLDELIERSALYDKLKKKYGGSFETILKHCETAKKELSDMDNQEEKKIELLEQLQFSVSQYTKIAQEISVLRKNNSQSLEKSIIEELTYLGMSDPDFKVNLTVEEDELSPILFNGIPVKYTLYGCDKVEFLISPNKGEPVKSLSKIASGGELSRIILALKSILGKNDSVRTMIFDEIDVGIGGKVALSVSSKIKQLSKEKQIICITHLPQIAANGDGNFLIHKEVNEGRTSSKILKLDERQKISEIARMLSGSLTENSLKHAEELITSLK